MNIFNKETDLKTAAILIEAFGGLSATGRLFGVTPSAVKKWAQRGWPANNCKLAVKLAKDYNVNIKCEHLRHDIYAPEV